MIRAKSPSSSNIYVKLNPPDADSAETAAAADVLFDLRDQDLDVAGYQLHWDTKLDPGQSCARSTTVGDWTLCSGLAILPDEMADHLPSNIDGNGKDADSKSKK